MSSFSPYHQPVVPVIDRYRRDTRGRMRSGGSGSPRQWLRNVGVFATNLRERAKRSFDSGTVNGRRPFPDAFPRDFTDRVVAEWLSSTTPDAALDRVVIFRWITTGGRDKERSFRVLARRSWRTAKKDGRADYIVAPDGILHIPTSTCHVGIYDPKLLTCIPQAMFRIAAVVRKRQDELEREVSGIITSDDRFRDITAQMCDTDRGSRHSSDPFCGGWRRCMLTEVTEGRIILGEFHSHPRMKVEPADSSGSTETKNLPEVTFFPPSGHDLFQLCMAAFDAVHNCSVVLAPEGVYVSQVDPAAYMAVFRDLEIYYAQNDVAPKDMLRSVSRCRQPILDLIRRDGSTPYLADVFDMAQHYYTHVTYAQELEKNDTKIALFIRSIERRLGIRIRFFPNPT